MSFFSDFSPNRIRTFPGINDLPTEPTAQKAGNGAHLIRQYNDFIASAQYSLNLLEELAASSPPARTQVVDADSGAAAGDTVIVLDYISNRDTRIILPPGGNPVGGVVRMLHVNPLNTIRIVSGQNPVIRYKGFDVAEIYFTAAYEFVSLIYVGFDNQTNSFIGWIPSKDSLFQTS